jgi:hypothetical protein
VVLLGKIFVLIIERYMHYRNELICRAPDTLGKEPKTLGNRYAEHSAQHTRLGMFSICSCTCAAAHIEGARHIHVCRVQGLDVAKHNGQRKKVMTISI